MNRHDSWVMWSLGKIFILRSKIRIYIIIYMYDSLPKVIFLFKTRWEYVSKWIVRKGDYFIDFRSTKLRSQSHFTLKNRLIPVTHTKNVWKSLKLNHILQDWPKNVKVYIFKRSIFNHKTIMLWGIVGSWRVKLTFQKVCHFHPIINLFPSWGQRLWSLAI
jgi:hypothetical protein